MTGQVGAPSTVAIDPADVRDGLGGPGPKTLPSKYFYDAVGSALFEAICHLPEYGLTRAGERLLQRHAGAIVADLAPPLRVVELGSGSGRKTPWLLAALARGGAVTYHPVDISEAALEDCARAMGGIDGVSVAPLQAEYLDGVARATRRREAGERLLVLFLGSTIGNFERDEAVLFLRALRGRLVPGDALLLAADLIKPLGRMLPAYDDPAGVTAAFNRNLLARIDRELDADFDAARFAHEARWNAELRCVEMHLRTDIARRVHVRGAELVVDLAAGETIRTERSHKFAPGEPVALGRRAGFVAAGQWVDEEWPFAQALLLAG